MTPIGVVVLHGITVDGPTFRPLSRRPWRFGAPPRGYRTGMATDKPPANAGHGIAAEQLADLDLRRELAYLHQTRHETMLHGSDDAFETHTRRMLELEQEFVRR